MADLWGLVSKRARVSPGPRSHTSCCTCKTLLTLLRRRWVRSCLLGISRIVNMGVTYAGWKDTVDLAPGEEARVIARFDGYRGRYVFHWHKLRHEDMMMMASFEVV